jgi:valyl-tRNA synthetase
MSQISEKFLKPYNPNETESKIYEMWENSGLFNPDISVQKGFTKPDAEKFSMVLPPPNVTGVLHMGHASMLTIEDIMVRYHRMTGKKTLWLPGTDHAAIATQSVVEKKLSKEGIKKTDLGREKFLEKVEEFVNESKNTITKQTKSMGASLDWSRLAFTLDEKREVAVRTAFKKMYEDGLIYRGYRIVNWDPKGQTTVSDDEVIYEAKKAKLYYFKYSHDFPITIATTRPETKVGDTGVAVNPNDARYKDLIGQVFEVDFCGVKLKLKVFGDENVDPEFGTGAVGVTPAHSFVDFEMAQKNNLPVIPVINEFAKMTVGDENLNGKKTTEAREIIVKWLEENNLMEKVEEFDQNISTAERTGGVIEPLPKLQWFINVNKPFTVGDSKLNNVKSGSTVTLKEIMKTAVESEQIKILPDRFEKVYYSWINNLRDWCISRQIWYGHQIPVWYKNQGTDSEEIYVGLTAPEGNDWVQDPDTLDTWFSSGLWTFSTLGWPEKTEDFLNFHPTDVLETGTDIIFFWVARMILMSGYLLNDIPFKTVYLHGLVRDSQGRKLSKSLGNGGDPIEMAEKFGADAVRMSLIVGVGPGNDLNLSEDKIRAYKKFGNKIWNASRFILENVSDGDFENAELHADDQKIMDEFEIFMKDLTDDMNNFRFYLASEKVYHYFWHTFADIIIEQSKEFINIEGGKDGSEKIVPSAEQITRKKSRQKLLYTLLIRNLKAIHPFMPFVTEEIWQNLKAKETEYLMVANWQ